jgi:hypothetical protein
MMRTGNFILRQSKNLLENKQQAIMFAVLFALLPFASWLSVALVLLVTLRRGAKAGFEVMLPALVIHSVPLMMLVSVESALINTLIIYVPCYLAALVLRSTTSWQTVFGVFFLQALIGFLVIHLCAPDFILDQFNQFKNLLGQFQEYKQLLDAGTDGINTFVLAQLFFGIQILSVVVSALISLIFARSIQAKLFVPGGFSSELLAFRSGRFSFLILMAVSIASYFEISYAINVLPLVLSYFLVSGFALAFYALARKRQLRIMTLLVLLIFLKPFFVLFVYVLLGALDSLFNFRLYLPVRVREST